jgi:hypothetical protein
MILPAVLYGCETWSLTLREEHRLRAFQNRVLKRIFVPKRDEVTGRIVTSLKILPTKVYLSIWSHILLTLKIVRTVFEQIAIMFYGTQFFNVHIHRTATYDGQKLKYRIRITSVQLFTG